MHIIKRGKKYLSLFFILVFFCFISFASANDLQKSSKGVNYDKEILEKLNKENNTFIEVIIEFGDKDKLNQVTSEVLNKKFDLTNKEIRDISKWDYSNRIDAQLTKEGFEKLLNDSRIKSIYYDFSVQAALNDSTQIIGATYVWNLGYTGDGVKVCIIDSGIDNAHPDLSGKIVSEYCYCDKLFGGCCPDGTNEDNNASDDNGHGTHVAGIIASQDSTYKGVAYDVDIYAVKVLDEDGKGKISDIGKAIDWCNDQDVDIISISIGGWKRAPGRFGLPRNY